LRSLADAEDFGSIDADTDQLLTQSFEDHEAFLDLRDMKKFLIIGKKGSGKTAIFKQIVKKKTDP
jgi:ABC-type phosphate/phosphonate transport system ATPase subunit